MAIRQLELLAMGPDPPAPRARTRCSCACTPVHVHCTSTRACFTCCSLPAPTTTCVPAAAHAGGGLPVGAGVLSSADAVRCGTRYFAFFVTAPIIIEILLATCGCLASTLIQVSVGSRC